MGREKVMNQQVNESNIDSNGSSPATQYWLEEYRSLRREIELLLTSMRYMVMLNITALGTIASFALPNAEEYGLLLLIIPILSAAIGITVYFHSRRITQLGDYIEYKIARNIRKITGDKKVLGWEHYLRIEETKRGRFFRWFSIPGTMLLTFIFPAILALIYVAKQSFAAGVGWFILWLVGLALTILLILGFVEGRRLWFGKRKGSK
jgi:hypothetical protein